LEIDGLLARSVLVPKYNEVIDRESAFELLEQRLNAGGEAAEPAAPAPGKGSTKPAAKEVGTLEKLSRNTMVRQVGNTVMRELARGLLGVLGLRSTGRRR
jgi:hypothetical protein